MIIHWGKDVVEIPPELAMVYKYSGGLWVFSFAYGAEFFETDAEKNIVGPASLTDAERSAAWAQVPFMRKYGLFVLFAALVILGLFVE